MGASPGSGGLIMTHLARAAAFALALLVPLSPRAEEALTFAFLPYLAESELIERYTPLARYLGKAVGRTIEIEVAPTYDAHIWAVERDEPDIAFLGASPYVKIIDKVGPRPLLARYEIQGQPTFRGVIFTRKDSTLETLADLKGKRLGLGSHQSTLSHILPRHALESAGVAVSDLAEARTLKTHDNIVFAVLMGEVDAGAGAQEVFEEHKERGLRALGYSEAISTHVLLASPRLAPDLRAKLSEALTDLKGRPEAKAVLGALGASITGFAPVADSDYDNLRRILGAGK